MPTIIMVYIMNPQDNNRYNIHKPGSYIYIILYQESLCIELIYI